MGSTGRGILRPTSGGWTPIQTGDPEATGVPRGCNRPRRLSFSVFQGCAEAPRDRRSARFRGTTTSVFVVSRAQGLPFGAIGESGGGRGPFAAMRGLSPRQAIEAIPPSPECRDVQAVSDPSSRAWAPHVNVVAATIPAGIVRSALAPILCLSSMVLKLLIWVRHGFPGFRPSLPPLPTDAAPARRRSPWMLPDRATESRTRRGWRPGLPSARRRRRWSPCPIPSGAMRLKRGGVCSACACRRLRESRVPECGRAFPDMLRVCGMPAVPLPVLRLAGKTGRSRKAPLTPEESHAARELAATANGRS